MNDLLTAGLAALHAGCSLVPIDKTTKRPHYDLLPQVCSIPRLEKDGVYMDSRGAPMKQGSVDRGKGSWAHFQYNRPTETELREWVRKGAQLALVGGAVSGGLECLDFDTIDSTGASLHDAWRADVDTQADGLIWQRTGGGGYQYVFRSSACEENQKLAYLPDPAARSGESIAIETRGEHGYFIIAPSLHPSGNRYQLLAGEWGNIPTISPTRRAVLFAVARALCQSKLRKDEDAERAARNAPRKASTYTGLNGQVSVIDAYNEAYTVTQELERAGYKWRGRRLYLPDGGDEHRPGVVILDGVSYHHDSDDPLSDGYAHAAFDVFCHYQHSKDLGAAVKAAAGLLNIPYEPHGKPMFDTDGFACCPEHGVVLKQGKKSGYYCPHPDASQPSGYCVFWWRGDGYVLPKVRPAEQIEKKSTPDSPTEDGPATSRGMQFSERMLSMLDTLGYSFRLNVLDDTIEVNGEMLTEVIESKMRTELRDAGLGRSLGAMKDVYTTEAARNAYHPIKSYLESLVWDGTPRIGKLARYFTCSDPDLVYPNGQREPLFVVYLGRWLIGAVAKVYQQAQNLMLVLSGPQGKGKSAFIRWLCKNIPAYYAEAPLVPGDRLCDLRVINTFIWEVSELDATTRKADVAALKAFITRETVTTRKYHALHDIKKPVTASFAGTVNDSGSGFLVDDSGSRRFMVASITAIDFSYTEIDIDQVWAEALYLYRIGASWRLNEFESEMQHELNKNYEVGDMLEGWLERYFWFDETDVVGMTSADIVDHLRSKDVPINGDKGWETRIGSVLRKRGIVKKQVQTSGQRVRRYFGIVPITQ